MSSDPRSAHLDTSDPCATPNQGCACDDEGSTVECGKVVETEEDYVTCSMGQRACSDGKWGACLGERRTQNVSTSANAGSTYRVQALGTSAQCPAGFDPCDPFCQQIVDSAGGFTTGTGLQNSSSGLTLSQSVAAGCNSLSISAPSTTLHVNKLSPVTLQEGTVALTAQLSPSTCRTAPFLTTWTLDRFDVAQVTGTSSANGAFTMTSPFAGDVKVTAYAAGLSATLTLKVVVNVLEAPTTNTLASPNTAANGTQIAGFGSVASPLGGTTASTATWLYPYSGTYFPLGLLPPTMMYRYQSAGGGAVKVSLRYPTGKTATQADFNYSLIVKETNTVSQSAGMTANSLDPQVIVPKIAWQAFEQTARNANADIIVQRMTAAGTLEQENARPIHFVNGQLKGTVYYNSYSSPQGGNTGAVLSIAPGASSPSLAVQPSGKCTVCHSINLNGTQLIANGARTTNSYSFNQSTRYNLTSGAAPSPAVLGNYDAPAGDTENVPGDRFTFGAPLTDGAFYMTHGGTSAGDPNFRAPPDYSNLFSVSAPSTVVSVAGWPSNVYAVTPRFSVDGTKLAFGFWGGSSLAKSPSGTLGSGTKLAVVDFTCASPPCGAGDSGFAVSNARDLTPGVTEKTAWPSFTPSGQAVLYQRQYRSSKTVVPWSPSDVNTSTGALSEIWASTVPTNGSTASVPTRLSSLNGLDASGNSYLPTRPRTIVDNANPLYTFPTYRYDLVQSGASGVPSVYVIGTAASSGTNALTPGELRLDIVNGGSRGTATFRYSTNGGGSWSGTLTTNASVALGSNTGLTAVFDTGTYNSASIYNGYVGAVTLAGTPQGGPWDFRIAIVTGGARGTATFKYSTNGGGTWSGTPYPITAATPVALGSTGMTVSFANITYTANWNWGAWVSNYHDPNAKFVINVADNCRASGVADAVNDHRLNYVPSVNPTLAGDMAWVVFTSRRMYGNVAYDDPWDAEPAATNGTPYACYSDTPPTKKLWIAAVDPTLTGGTDPSHPAFYLPGQELAAGNSHAYWVNTPCAATGATCSTSDDCCGGSGSSPTARCNGSTKMCQSITTCAAVNGACASNADCCNGLLCNGSGVCANPTFYGTQTFEREYVAECPVGHKVAWRHFEWQATIPTGTSINLGVQTKAATGTYEPTTAVALATISSTSAAGAWVHGADTVDTVLKNASVPSREYLLVSMTLNGDADGLTAPTLSAWRQNFDCLPAE